MRRKPLPRSELSPAQRDGRRAVLAALLLLFVIAASLSDGKLLPTFHPTLANDGIARAEPGDDDLKTGSILLVPTYGNVCEHRLIDNATWRIRGNGTVACDNAVSWNSGQPERFTSETRIDAIRHGFFPKK